MKHFREFIDEKTRKAKRELGLLKKVFEQQGMKAQSKMDKEGEKDEPYLFVPTKEDVSFGGVRIYKIGDKLAYRIQKEEDTQPYGRAYPLDVEEMFNDLVSDHMNEERAGRRVMEAVAGEIQKFFEKSKKAEQEIQSLKLDQKGKVQVGSNVFGGSIAFTQL